MPSRTLPAGPRAGIPCFAAATLVACLLSSVRPTRSDPSSFHGQAETLPLNPLVQTLVDSVSAERLEASVLALAGFQTRHTNSDTTSTTSGIGAARNWVRDQLTVYSAGNGGVQSVGFFDWDGNSCAIQATYRNVMAEQIGTVYPDRRFVVGAHLDSRTVNSCDATGFAPGADDDGSGCAIVLELAYLLGKLSLDSSMQFFTFTGEEQGLLGSRAYAEWALQSGLDIAGMFNNDTCGNIFDIGGAADSTRVRVFSGEPATSSSRQLARYVKLKAEAYQPEFTVDLIPLLDRPGRGGDHIPFYENGFAAARLIEQLENGDGTGANGHQHNGTDLPEFMNFPYLERVCKVNVAAIASILLAPQPPTGVSAADAGNGADVAVAWEPNVEADLAGYRVAFRFETGDSLFYQQIFDAGLSTSYTITGLATGVPILVSVSAYDEDFNESVFSEEHRVVPAIVPTAPERFDATSRFDRIELSWDANPELDIAAYNLYRATAAQGPYDLLAVVPAPGTRFDDLTASPAVIYHYRVAAEDFDGHEGPAAGPMKGRLVDHAAEILIVDASIDGPGGSVPTDAQVDLFYAGILADAAVAGEWDRADSVAAGVVLSDADLGAHRTVVYHLDAFDTNVRTQTDTTALRKYVQNGGRLLLSGSRISFTLGGSQQSVNAWVPGQFMHDVLKSTETRQSLEFDLTGAFGQVPGYPDLDIDGSKIFFDRLPLQDAHTGPLVDVPTTEVLYRYQSLGGTGANHQLPNAIRFLGADLRLVAFSFPLYFMDSLSVRQTVASALADLGEGTTAIALTAPTARLEFGLGRATPNPFNPATRIEYIADRRGERLRLRVFDVHGRLVRGLADGVIEPGRHVVDWDGRSDSGRPVTSGLYFIELRGAEGRSARQKLVLLR